MLSVNNVNRGSDSHSKPIQICPRKSVHLALIIVNSVIPTHQFARNVRKDLSVTIKVSAAQLIQIIVQFLMLTVVILVSTIISKLAITVNNAACGMLLIKERTMIQSSILIDAQK